MSSLARLASKTILESKLPTDTLAPGQKHELLSYQYLTRRANWYYIPTAFSRAYIPIDSLKLQAAREAQETWPVVREEIIRINQIIAEIDTNSIERNKELAEEFYAKIVLRLENDPDAVVKSFGNPGGLLRLTELMHEIRDSEDPQTVAQMTKWIIGSLDGYMAVIGFPYRHSKGIIAAADVNTNVPIPDGYKFTESEFENWRQSIYLHNEKLVGDDYIPEFQDLMQAVNLVRGDIVRTEVNKKYWIFDGNTFFECPKSEYIIHEVHPFGVINGTIFGIPATLGLNVITEFPINYWQRQYGEIDETFYNVITNIDFNKMVLNEDKGTHYIFNYVHQYPEFSLEIVYIIVVKKKREAFVDGKTAVDGLTLYNRPPSDVDYRESFYMADMSQEDEEGEEEQDGGAPTIPEWIVELWKQNKNNFMFATYDGPALYGELDKSL